MTTISAHLLTDTPRTVQQPFKLTAYTFLNRQVIFLGGIFYQFHPPLL